MSSQDLKQTILNVMEVSHASTFKAKEIGQEVGRHPVSVGMALSEMKSEGLVEEVDPDVHKVRWRRTDRDEPNGARWPSMVFVTATGLKYHAFENCMAIRDGANSYTDRSLSDAQIAMDACLRCERRLKRRRDSE